MVLTPRSLFVLTLASFAAAGAAEAEAVDDEGAVLLLQTSTGLQRRSAVRPAEEDSQAERLEAALPFVYLHVPKTGSSIVNAFLRLPGVCPEFAAELGDDSFSGGRDEGQFEPFRNNSLCEGLAPPPSVGLAVVRGVYVFGFHSHVGNASVFDEHYDGHGVTMLRQPEQRVISGLRHASDRSGVAVESLQFSEGCTARMLVGDENSFRGTDAEAACFASRQSDPPLPEVPADDVAEAVARLRRFAFVGIQSEWHLSVCLLHAMFGGECHATEFANTRPSPMSQASADLYQGNVEAVFAAPEPYDTEILGGWVDAADRAVYDAGLELFHARCEEHGVTPETCRPCYETAGLL